MTPEVRRLIRLGVAWLILLAAAAGLGRVLAAHDPLTDLIRADGAVLPVLLLFYAARIMLFVLPGVAVSGLVRGRMAARDASVSGDHVA